MCSHARSVAHAGHAVIPSTPAQAAHPALCACVLLFPPPQEKALFEREIKYHTLVHEQLIQFYRCAPWVLQPCSLL